MTKKLIKKSNKNKGVKTKMKKLMKNLSNKKEIHFLKNLYEDFKETMGETLGDAGDTFKKHKLLIIVAFLAFLYYRNKQFSIGQFVQKLEDRIRGKAKEEGW